MKVLLGVGNTLLSDDGVGCFIADRFDKVVRFDGFNWFDEFHGSDGSSSDDRSSDVHSSDNLSSDIHSSNGCSSDSLSSGGWRAFHGGTAPENFTAPIRRLEPEILVIVDAADMGLPPGSIRIIPPDQIDDTSIGTHMLPLSHLIHYLSSDIPEILFIGIQPETIGPGEGLSSAAETAAEALINVLKKGDYASLERL